MRYLLLILLALQGCKISSDDKETHREELRAYLAEAAKWGENRRKVREVKQAFAQQFQGKVRPGVGCTVCPDMCKNADLRQVTVAEFHRLYRKAALEHGYPKDDWMYQLAWLELLRLGCIAQDGGQIMKQAWLPLLNAREDPAVRYFAAVQAMELKFAPDEGLRVLRELAQGSSKFALSAQINVEELELGIEPTL